MRFGAIDIGTNAARLLIGEVEEDETQTFVKKVSYTRIPLRLGFEVFSKGELSTKKITEFTKSIQAFKLIAEVFDVEELRACATSAMREAKNGKKVKEHILKETGVQIEIIKGEEEAELILSNFYLKGMDLDHPFMVIDVGGGSTEISFFKKGEMTHSKSFKMGTIRILEGKVSEGQWKKLKTWLSELPSFGEGFRVYGTGGNINKIHKILGKKSKEGVKEEELEELLADMESLTIEQRISKYQLRPDRADVIVPALKIYTTILNKISVDEILVPKIGLSDGIVYQLYKKHLDKK